MAEDTSTRGSSHNPLQLTLMQLFVITLCVKINNLGINYNKDGMQYNRTILELS